MAAPHMVRTGLQHGPDSGPDEISQRAPSPSASLVSACRMAASHASDQRSVRSWPLLLLALPASVAVWSGWVGIGRLTGFGEVRPLPGIWNSLHLDTAVTLPVGVEAYAAYALHAWLAGSVPLSVRTRQFAKWSAIGSLLLGMAGQVAYHLLTQAGATRAPWGVTTAVSCLPVLILGMAAGLAHLIRSDLSADGKTPGLKRAGADRSEATVRLLSAERLEQGRVAAAQLIAAGQRVSRRTLRTAGLRGSNVELGTLARLISPELEETRMQYEADQRSSQH
jgi:hypothetical protein